MVKTLLNSKQKIAHLLIFALFAVFPFGQVIKLGIFNLFDVIVVFIALFTLFSRPKYPFWYRYVLAFVALGLFSWVFNAFILSNTLTYKGFLYLVRIFAYSLLPVFITNFFKTKADKSMILGGLLTAALATAVFGWAQYILIPDTRPFKILGWDDHYYRLIGTFLDPTFTAIILVLGTALVIYKKKLFASLFLIITLAFTYSRAGYLALLVVFLYFIVKRQQIKITLLYILVFFALFLVLPKSPGGEGVFLGRTSTITARLSNYNQSLKLISSSPAIGFGLNNICPAKQLILSDSDPDSHSCFGVDSSILFILATTGIIGLMLFFNIFLSIYNQTPKDTLLTVSFLAVFIHSFFSNSLFYPHVMAWMGILIGLRSKIKTN